MNKSSIMKRSILFFIFGLICFNAPCETIRFRILFEVYDNFTGIQYCTPRYDEDVFLFVTYKGADIECIECKRGSIFGSWKYITVPNTKNIAKDYDDNICEAQYAELTRHNNTTLFLLTTKTLDSNIVRFTLKQVGVNHKNIRTYICVKSD